MIENTAVGQFSQVTSRLKTQSAVVPALILSAVCSSVGLMGVLFSEPAYSLFFCVILGAGLLLPAIQIVYFTFTDKDRLQNEDHVERKMLLAQMRPEIGDGHSVIDISASSLPLISNPSVNSEETPSA